MLAGEPSTPTIVCLQAGNVNTGASDDFEAAIPLAHERGAWVHVDGAFGLWAAASPRHAELVAGVEQADSWATDAHKWLNVPYDSGLAIVADAEAHGRTMSYTADYLAGSGRPTSRSATWCRTPPGGRAASRSGRRPGSSADRV